MLLYRSAVMLLFQSTLPREERHCLIVKTSLYSYFNPRSHERSDLKRCKYMRYKIISIHAPTRGATVPASASHSSVVFQSTLPREERPGSFPAAVGLMLHFNPRSHERSDQVVSYSPPGIRDFNPRSHERSDQQKMQAEISM